MDSVNGPAGEGAPEVEPATAETVQQPAADASAASATQGQPVAAAPRRSISERLGTKGIAAAAAAIGLFVGVAGASVVDHHDGHGGHGGWEHGMRGDRDGMRGGWGGPQGGPPMWQQQGGAQQAPAVPPAGQHGNGTGGGAQTAPPAGRQNGSWYGPAVSSGSSY